MQAVNAHMRRRNRVTPPDRVVGKGKSVHVTHTHTFAQLCDIYWIVS